MPNPFLPLDEYIADGDPHVFGDRVYVIGSHDEAGGDAFCALDYVFYSAPIDDLSNWSARGTSYRAEQDPSFGGDRTNLWAPDVVRGNDGRFYLYYCMGGRIPRTGWQGPIGVAVCDIPDGEYEFHGYVRQEDGSVFDDYLLFDPSVINDEGVIRLYFGFCLPYEDGPAILRPVYDRLIAATLGKPLAKVRSRPGGIQGAITVQLADDMLTVQSEPRRVLPTRVTGTSFEGHAFLEACSIRKIESTYYLVYSSINGHELCYATSSHPDRDFQFGGTIVSNGDVGIGGREPRDRVNSTGNNHGGIENINGEWYVFYHRHTNNSDWNRQACAERISFAADGSIPQIEMTSSGPTQVPLPSSGTYPAALSCALTNGRMPHGVSRIRHVPRITEEDGLVFVHGMTNGTELGYKYFDFDRPVRLSVRTRGSGGELSILSGGQKIGSIDVLSGPSGWTASTSAPLPVRHGAADLRLRFAGAKSLDVLDLTFLPVEH